MLQCKVFIIEFLTKDGLAASSVIFCEIATLGHEVLDDAVEFTALKGQRLSSQASTGRADSKCGKVFRSSGNGVTEQAKDEATGRLAVLVHVEVDLLSHGVQSVRGCISHEHKESCQFHSFDDFNYKRKLKSLLTSRIS